MSAIEEAGEVEGGVPGKPWAAEEIEVAVAAYLCMLRMQESGQTINKSEVNRRTKARLPARTMSSLSQKYSNISAVLHLLGVQSLSGYRPLFNFQRALAESVERNVARDFTFESLAIKRVQSSIETPVVADYSSILVAPPNGVSQSVARSSQSLPGVGVHKDYLAREALNQSIGLAGEHVALNFEVSRLITSGYPELAARVEHVSKTRGDGLGFDIRSFCIDGTPRLIEVKTTSYGIDTPIFLSANEITCSAQHGHSYWIYRVFNIRSTPRIFMIPGPVSSSFVLEATTFRAWLRSKP